MLVWIVEFTNLNFFIMRASTDFSQRKLSTDNFTEPVDSIYKGGIVCREQQLLQKS